VDRRRAGSRTSAICPLSCAPRRLLPAAGIALRAQPNRAPKSRTDPAALQPGSRSDSFSDGRPAGTLPAGAGELLARGLSPTGPTRFPNTRHAVELGRIESAVSRLPPGGRSPLAPTGSRRADPP